MKKNIKRRKDILFTKIFFKIYNKEQNIDDSKCYLLLLCDMTQVLFIGMYGVFIVLWAL